MEQTTYFECIDQAYATLTGPALEQRLTELVFQSKEEFGCESVFYASMLGELGGFYRGQARYEESESCFRSALGILTQKLGENHPDRATMLNNLAGTHRLMGKHDEAEQEFLACLQCYGRTLGTEHILYASGLNNLSLLYMDKKDFTGAANYLAKAAAILSCLPQHLDEYATSLCNLANLYHYQEQFQEAKSNLEQAIELYETVLGTRTPHYHAALNSLGIVLIKMGNLEEACLPLQKAADAAAALYGPQHREFQGIHSNLVYIKEQLGAEQ